MPYRSSVATGIALCLLAVACPATAATSTIEIDPTNTIPNVIANALIADGEGDDWTGAVLQVDLTAGSVYNDPGFDSDGVQEALWGFVPLLRWDSAIGIAGDGSAGIAGGCCIRPHPQNLSGTGVGAAQITWFNTATDNTAPVQIANISMTDDAAGVWSLITSFASGQVRTSGPVINGVMAPEPTSLALLSMSGLMLVRVRGSGSA